MPPINVITSQYQSSDDIISLCQKLLKKDDSTVAKEDKTACTESGCTGRAVAFDFIKSGMIDKINARLIKEMEANREDTHKVHQLYNNFNALRQYRADIETSTKHRNLPTLIETFLTQNVVRYLYEVSFNFDDNIEQCVRKYTETIGGYKKELHNIENQMEHLSGTHSLEGAMSNHKKLKRYISHGFETYKYLLQQLVCIKAYVYQGNNSFNQKRPAMSLTAALLSKFASGELFMVAREVILPTIGIIARDAGHTKCSAISIIKLTTVLQQCVNKGLLSSKYLSSNQGDNFFEMFIDTMGFISDVVNKTKNGKAAYVAVHLAEQLITQWAVDGKMSDEFKATSERISKFNYITTQMACDLYHGEQKTFRADEICQHPGVKIERPNYYNPERQDRLRYGILFSTAPTLIDSQAFKNFYGIKDSHKLEGILDSKVDRNHFFTIESGKSIEDCTIRIMLGDIDEIIDKPFDALVNCNIENFEEIQLNETLLEEILRPENIGKYNEILIPEYQKLYETPLKINPKYLKKDYLIGSLVSKPYYDVLTDVENLINSNELSILHKINLKKTLYEAGGVEIPKCTVFIVGNENLHAQALIEDPYASLLVPTNVVVMEHGNDTSLFALNPVTLHEKIKDFNISRVILDNLKERIENVIQLKHGQYTDNLKINDQQGSSSGLRAQHKSFALMKTYSGVDINKVLDKVLFVSKASKFGNELTQLGVVNLKNGQKSDVNATDGSVFVPLIGKLETVAKDIKHDPSVLALWPYRLSVNSVNGEEVAVSAINPSAIVEATGDSYFLSFSEDILNRLSSTFEDVQSELI